jgi:hypothetical protein
MGIPVWEYRTDDVVGELVNEALSQELIDRLLECQCWVVTDKVENEQMHRLLHAMLFSIDIDASQFALIYPEHISEVMQLDASNKVILFLGELQDTNLADKNISVVSHSLLKLLEQAELKSEAWLALLRVKQALARC